MILIVYMIGYYYPHLAGMNSETSYTLGEDFLLVACDTFSLSAVVSKSVLLD